MGFLSNAGARGAHQLPRDPVPRDGVTVSCFRSFPRRPTVRAGTRPSALALMTLPSSAGHYCQLDAGRHDTRSPSGGDGVEGPCRAAGRKGAWDRGGLRAGAWREARAGSSGQGRRPRRPRGLAVTAAVGSSGSRDSPRPSLQPCPGHLEALDPGTQRAVLVVFLAVSFRITSAKAVRAVPGALARGFHGRGGKRLAGALHTPPCRLSHTP